TFSKLTMFMYYEGYLLTPNEALAILFLIFGFYTVVGNVLVFVVYIIDPDKKLRRVSNSYFVISLAVADILVGITVEPINAASYWTNNRRVLFSYFIFAVLSCVCSIVNISALMADRFLAVCRPFQYRSLMSPNRVRWALLLIWLFSIHFSILPLVGWRSASFQIYLYGMGVLSPATLMLISYYGLLRALKKKMINLKISTDRKEVTQVEKTVARERRVSTTVFIMLIVFLVAWGPFVMVDFVLVFCESCRSEKLLLARDITLTIGFFSSGINPGLYAWRVPNFRHGLMLLFQRGIKTKSRLVRVVPLEKDGPSGVMDSDSCILKSNLHNLAYHVNKTQKETINSV
ncbi:adenosine receptor A1-like, partial [Stylophora pistillata]|uniref:adenosine receptor A1-like n=1 Tax=Stylophora pistillata TaxID=50429 RepID=UPI000C053F11